MESDKEELYEKLSADNFLQFYDNFDSVKELINFFRSRKRPKISLFYMPSETGSEITAVIPTKSVETDHVKRLIRKLRSLNILFVESNGPFFNFSYSMNVGIREAIRLRSRFIMLSNDDVFPLNYITQLEDEVVKNGVDYDIFLPNITNGTEYVSSMQKIYIQSWATNHIISNSAISSIIQSSTSQSARFFVNKLKIYRDHDILKYIVLRNHDPIFRNGYLRLAGNVLEHLSKRFHRELIEINNIQPVSILKADILKRETFDESFVNGGEDTDLSVRLAISGARVSNLKESFQDVGGYSLMHNQDRILKNTLPEILILGYKLNSYFPRQ